jgi:hypothetical protein
MKQVLDMDKESFIKISNAYVQWSGRITQLAIELVYKDTVSRKDSKLVVGVKDLMDYLLYTCNAIMTDNVVDSNIKLIEDTTFTYIIRLNIASFNKLLRVSPKSTCSDVKFTQRSTLPPDTLLDFIKQLISSSVITTNKTDTSSGASVLITGALIDYSEGFAEFHLNKSLVAKLTPQNKYRSKYLLDSLVMSSSYCKNLHTFISYYADVIKSGRWSNGAAYTSTTLITLADAMGLKYDQKLSDYDTKSNTYARGNMVQYIKKYVNEINTKTRLCEVYGKLNYALTYTRTAKNHKMVTGVRFYFEEE